VEGGDSPGASAERQFAVKVYRSGDFNTRYFRNEVRMLRAIQALAEKSQLGDHSEHLRSLVRYYGAFAEVAFYGEFPEVHPCVRFELAGDHIGRQLRRGPLSIAHANHVTRQLLGALSFLHSHNIIHTDVKPENVFVRCETENGPEIVLGDLGTSTFADDLFSEHIGTVPYLAPESLVGQPYTHAVDIWAAYAMYFELVTGSLLFDIYSECDIQYGGDVREYADNVEDYSDGSCDSRRSGRDADGDSRHGGGASAGADSVSRRSNVADGDIGSAEDSVKGSGGDGADSRSSDSVRFYISSVYHFMLMEKMLGRPPKKFWQEAREFFNRRGKLKDNPEIVPLSISEILRSQFNFEKSTADRVQKFILTGVQYLPESRPVANEQIEYP
jgi:serine/threonine protein kinase